MTGHAGATTSIEDNGGKTMLNLYAVTYWTEYDIYNE